MVAVGKGLRHLESHRRRILPRFRRPRSPPTPMHPSGLRRDPLNSCVFHLNVLLDLTIIKCKYRGPLFDYVPRLGLPRFPPRPRELAPGAAPRPVILLDDLRQLLV